ncbi:MAG: ferritin family protein [Desulfotomaculaceae bacterium]
MEKQTKLVDILKMALLMEERGYRFYTTLAGLVKDDRVKQLALKLAGDEKEHKKIFAQIINEYSGDETLEQEGMSYLNAIGKGIIFPDISGIKDLAEKIDSFKDVLSIAIEAEKDAILLFHELTVRIHSQKVNRIIYKLLEEEKMHLIELRNYLEEV